MTPMSKPTITSLTVQPAFTLALRYSDGAALSVSVKPLVDAGGVFVSLRDPAVFAQARIGLNGRSVEWPGEIDLCADALRMQTTGVYQLAS